MLQTGPKRSRGSEVLYDPLRRRMIHWEFYKKLNLFIRPIGISTDTNLSLRIRCITLSGISFINMDHLILSRSLNLLLINQKKITGRLVDFAVLEENK